MAPIAPAATTQMNDTTKNNRHDSPEEPESSPDRPAVSYSPRQRRMIRKGFRAWARVSIRSFLGRRGVSLDECRTEQDGIRKPGCEPEP